MDIMKEFKAHHGLMALGAVVIVGGIYWYNKQKTSTAATTAAFSGSYANATGTLNMMPPNRANMGASTSMSTSAMGTPSMPPSAVTRSSAIMNAGMGAPSMQPSHANTSSAILSGGMGTPSMPSVVVNRAAPMSGMPTAMPMPANMINNNGVLISTKNSWG